MIADEDYELRAGHPLSAADAEKAIAGDDWRVAPLGPDGAAVEFFATDAGVTRYRAAPEEIICAWDARYDEASSR